MIALELIYDLSLLAAIIVFSGFISEKYDRSELTGKILQGILFGIAAIVGMLHPFELEKGLFFDGRSIVISLCTLFFGSLSGFISLIPAFVYRLIVGGAGVYMGTGTVISSFLIGLYFHKKRKEGFVLTNLRLYLFGLLVHFAMLLLVLTLPSNKIISTYQSLSFTIAVIYPLISFLISKVLLDQEEKKNATKLLEKNEKLFRTTLYSIGDAVITTDINGRIQNMNPIAEQLTGWKESEARGQFLSEVYVIVNEDTNIIQINPFEEIINSGKVVELANNTKLISKNGAEYPIADSGAPIIDDKGEIQGIVLIFRDQTKEKEKQRLIYESESRLKRAENIARAGNWEIDLTTGLIYGSEGAQKLYGLEGNVWKLEEVQELHLPEYREYLSNSITNLIKSNIPYDVEFKIKRPDGNILYIHSIAEYDKEKNRVFGVIEDITDYKNVIKALKESEEKFRAIFNRSFGLVGLLTPDGKILESNETALKMIGKSISELLYTQLEKSPWFSHSESEQKKVLDAIKQAAQGNFVRFDTTHIDYQGNLHYIDFSISPVKDENGNTILLIPEGRDVTDVIKAGNELKERERVYSTLLSNLPGFVYRCRNDKDWTMLFISNGCEEITGYKPEEFINNNVIAFNEIIGKEFQDTLWNEWQRVLKEKSVFEFEYKIKAKNGSIKWVWERGRGVYAEDGELMFLEGFITDITLRKEYEEALIESEELFRNLAESTSTAIFIYQGSKFVFANKAAEKLTGYSSEELLQHDFWEFVHPEFREIVKERGLARQKGLDVPNRYEFKILTKDKRGIWIDFAAGKINWKGQPAAIGSAFDINDKKLAELKLQEDEELFRAISNLTSDYLFSTNFDSDGNLIHTWVGGAFEKLTGYAIEEYRSIGGWRARVHPDDLEEDNEALQKLMRNENVISELRTIHKNGNIIWVRIYAKPVWDKKQNRLIGIQGAVQDITESKKAQLVQQIQYNIANAVTSSIKTHELFDIVRKELSQLMNTKNFFVAFYDEKTNTLTSDVDKDEKDTIKTWSAEKSLTGYLIKSQKTLLLKEEEIIELNNSGKIELVGTLPAIWLGTPLRVGNKIIGAVVVQSYDDPNAYDHSSLKIFEVIANQLSLYIQRKRSEEELTILARAIYQTPLSIVVTDTSGNIVYVNPSFEKISGYSKDEVLGQNIRFMNSSYHESEFYKNLWDTILSGIDWEGEILNKKKTGELYWEHQIISPVFNDENTITHFVAIKEDVTEKKKMIQEIIDAKEKAEASEKLKTEFLAQVSHEIRTPINIMTSNFQLIKDEVEDKIDPEFMELFSSISRASHRIIRTVDLILNMSEIQTGAYQPKIKRLNLDAEILQHLQIEYLHLAQGKKIELTYKCNSDDPIIYADEYSVMQIFANLIDNAIKYTDKGKVEVILYDENNGHKVVEVTDTGIGMSEEFLSKLFQPFVQEEHGYTRSYEGNGLGLALVKNYCSLNNASIEVKSKKNVGTTFTVKFKNQSDNS